MEIILWNRDGSGKKQAEEEAWVRRTESMTNNQVDKIFVRELEVMEGVNGKPKKMKVTMIRFGDGMEVISP